MKQARAIRAKWLKPADAALTKHQKAQQAQKVLREARLKELRIQRQKMILEKHRLIEDIMQDTMAFVHGSGLTHAQITANGGPHQSTLKSWSKQRTKLPQLATVRMILRAIGMDIKIT